MPPEQGTQPETRQPEPVPGEPGPAGSVPDGREQAGPGDGQRLAARPAVPAPRLLAIACVLTVILGGAGIWGIIAARNVPGSAAAANTALTDRAATTAVIRDVRSAVDTIFSYSYADTARTRSAAQRLLTGPAIRQYNRLFALVERQAPGQKLVVTTTVTNIGVEVLAGDRARLLVFANQQDSRAGTSQASYAGAMFAVTALRAGGRWLIDNIDTFSGG